jgi:hypothetical protein
MTTNELRYYPQNSNVCNRVSTRLISSDVAFDVEPAKVTMKINPSGMFVDRQIITGI